MVAKVGKKIIFSPGLQTKKGRATAAPKCSPLAVAKQLPLLAARCNSRGAHAHICRPFPKCHLYCGSGDILCVCNTKTALCCKTCV